MVMKPEPWGAALDEVAPDRPTIVFTTPSGEPFTQAVARELSTPRAPRLRVRPLRGHRPARHRRTPRPSAGPRDLPRRLRPQRGRGGRAGDHRGRRAADPGLHGQRRVAGRGVARGRAARVSRLHQARELARPRRPRRAALRRPRAGSRRWRHEQAVRRTAERRPDLLARLALPGADEVRPAAPADAGEILTLQRACWVARSAGQPGRRDPGPARDPGRRTALAGPRGPSSCAVGGPAGRARPAAPRAARRPCGRVGHRPADGGPRPPGPGARPVAAGAHRGGGAGRRRRRTSSSRAPGARTTCGCTRRPATGSAGPDLASPGAVVLTKKRRSPLLISQASPDLADSLLGPVGQNDRPEAHTRGVRDDHLPQGVRDAAGHDGGTTPIQHQLFPRLTCGTREETT